MPALHDQRRHGSAKDDFMHNDDEDRNEAKKMKSMRTSDNASEVNRRSKYSQKSSSSRKSHRSLTRSQKSGSTRSLSSSEKSSSPKTMESPKRISNSNSNRHHSKSGRYRKGERSSTRKMDSPVSRSSKGAVASATSASTLTGSDDPNTNVDILYVETRDHKQRQRPSKSRSQRSLKKDKSPSKEEKYAKTTLASRSEHLLSSSKSPKSSSRDRLSKSHHSQSSRSFTTNSSKRSDGSKSSSKHILYGSEDHDVNKAKMKSPSRATKPGVDRLHHNSLQKSQSSSTRDLLYGDDNELKKRNKRSSASTPGVERVQAGATELLYGDDDENSNSKTRTSRSSLHSSISPAAAQPAMNRNQDNNDDGGYSYDFPVVASEEPRRQAYSSLTVEDPYESGSGTSRTTAATDSISVIQENKRSKRIRKKSSTLCIISCILCALLLLVVGVVAGFMFLQPSDNDSTAPPQEIIPDAADNFTTLAPTAAVFATRVPSPMSPSSRTTSSPTAPSPLDPPSPDDCNAIANNATIPGQDNLVKRNFNIQLDITLSVHGDISEEAVQEILAALERLFIPTIAGCSSSTDRRNRRQLTSSYVIGNADVKGKTNPDAECKEGITAEPEKCHVIEVELTVYLKGDASDFEVLSMISEAGRGDLVPQLELPPDTFAEVAMSGAGGVEPSDAPSTKPSPSPSAPPSAAPSASPSVRRTSTPTVALTNSPSILSASPTGAPSESPTATSSQVPSALPTSTPSQAPVAALTPIPTTMPSTPPTVASSTSPSESVSLIPTFSPSATPTVTACYCTSATGADVACDASREQFNIGCHSCHGQGACYDLAKSSLAGGIPQIGLDACLGPLSCKEASIVTIGDGSCTAARACQDRHISVGVSSCTAESSCMGMPFEGNFWDPGRTELLTVGAHSCTNLQSCHVFHGLVGNKSCTGQYACAERYILNVGDNACLGEHSCSYVAPSNVGFPNVPLNIEVANGSCQGDYSCQCMTKVLIEGVCNSLGDCCDSDNPTLYAAGFSSTSKLY